MTLFDRVLAVTCAGALLVLAACGSSRTAEIESTTATRSGAPKRIALLDGDTSEEASYALYETEGMVLRGPVQSSPPFRQVIAAGWQSGRVIWRTGPPDGAKEMLATADLGTERVEQLTRELVGSLSQWDGNNFFGPDSSYQSFIARPGDGGVRVATWHELAERDPRLVCLDGGFRSVPPGTRDEVLAREASPSWLEFREAWSSMRARIDELIRTAPDRQPAAFPPERVQWAWK